MIIDSFAEGDSKRKTLHAPMETKRNTVKDWDIKIVEELSTLNGMLMEIDSKTVFLGTIYVYKNFLELINTIRL